LDAFNKNIKDNIENAKKELKNNAVIKEISDVIENRKNEDLSHQENVRESIEALSDDLDSLIDQKNDAERKEELRLKQEAFFRNLEYKDNEIADIENQLNAAEQSYEAQVKKIKSLEDNVGYYRVEDFKETENLILSVDGFLDEANGLANEIKGNIESARSNLHEASNKIGTSKENLGDVDAEYEIAEQEIKDTKKTIDDIQIANEEIKSILNKASKKEEGIKNQIIEKAKNIGDQLSSMIMAKKEEIDEKEKAIDQAENNYNQANSFYEEYPVEIAKDFEDRFFELSENFSQLDEEYGNKIGYLKNNLESIAKVKDKIEQASIEDGSIFSAIKEAEEVISDNISSEIVDNSDVDEFIAECNSFKEALSQEKFQQQLNSINLLLDRTQAIKSNNALADEGIKQFKTNLDALRENEFGESDDIKILLDQCEHNINSADNKRNELVAKAEKAMIGLKQISGEISGTYNNENVMPIKEEEISSHQRDIDILEEELRNFGVLLDDINSDLYKINKEIENKDKSDIDKLKNECINTKPLAQEVINKITENQKAIKEIHNDTDTYFRKYECVKEGKESSKEHTMNAIFEFEDKLEEQLAKAEEYENKINAEVTKIDSINSDKSVHGYKESVKKTIEKIKSDIGKDNKTQDENAGRITELSTKANELKEALEKAWLTKCNQAEIEVTGIKNKAKSINKSYQEKKKEITKLEAEVNDFKVNESSKIDEALGKKLTEVMYSIKYLERIQDQGTNDIIDFNKRLDDVLSIIESSKKGNNDIHSNNETIEHSIAGARNDINNFDQEVTSYLGILKQAKQTFETVKDIVEEKNKTNRRNAEIFLKQLKKQIDKINDNLDKFIIKASNVKESIQYSHEDIPKSLIHKYKDDFEDIKLGNEYFYDELRKYKEVAENVKHNIYEIDPSEFDDKEKSRYEINIEDFHKSLEEFEEQANKIDSNIAQLQQKIKDEFVDENRSGVNGLIQLNNSHGEIFSRIVEELNLLNHEANSILKECLPSEEAKPAAHALINEIRLLQNKIAKYKNDDEAVYLFKKIDLELHKIQAEIAKIEENKPALSYKDVVKKITGLSEYISRFNQDKNEKYVAQLRGFFGKIKNNFEKFKRSEKINLVLSLNDSIDVEGDLAEINEKISALDKDKQKCFDEAKESVNNVTRTSTTRVINEIIGGCNEINTRWNEALEKIKKVDQTKVGDLTRSFPPDYLPQIAEKKKIIDEFKKSFVLQVESLNNKLDGEDNRAEIEDIVQKFITYLSNINNTAICYSKKFEKIATYIYEDCHRKFSAEGSNFYRQYAINHPLMVSKEGHHVTDELKDVNLLTKAITDIIKGKEVNTPNIVERQIKEYFVNSTFDPDKIWQALHGVLCKAIIDSNGGNYNPETSSHVKGYMAGRIIQAVCLAVYAHMDKHVSNKLASDDLDDLKSQYDNIIKLLHPENWGIGASGDNRSSFISEASKRYIEQALEDTKNKISIKFSGIKGSPVAIKALEEHSDIKAMTSQLNKAVKLHAPEENNRLINSAKKLISSNPAFAKRWVETSLSLFYLGNQAIAGNTSSIEAYGMASQKLIVSLLQEFKINEQIPLSALLIATLKDISTANSLIRQALKLHYSKNKKDRKTNIDRVDKYANQIISLISK
ncbi:MAG: hypothetical protein PUP46_04420, partial [Endozoicomonas sp. (ex Botrylloides leachii)]|nr:hypothetical protein [Endozoicomonas sp. (ex Botrylloides leachii)]